MKDGYKGVAFQEISKNHLNIIFDENPYLKYPLELIRDIDVPLIKRNALNLDNDGFKNAIAAIMYIDKYKKYDVDIIKNHIIRKSLQKGNNPQINLDKLDEFYNNHKNIHIYGAGGWEINLGYYFKYKLWNLSGYLVSRKEDIRENVNLYDESKIEKNDGIIIAVSKKEIIEEIYDYVSIKHNEKHIFKPTYI